MGDFAEFGLAEVCFPDECGTSEFYWGIESEILEIDIVGEP